MYTERKEVNQIEVGSPYVGLEFHHSSLQPNRISFFYPAANTVDVSEDYWKRGNYPVMTFNLEFGGEQVDFTGDNFFNCKLFPYKVIFDREDDDKKIIVTYEFCLSKPAMIMKFELINNSCEEKEIFLNTSLEISLKTSCTYNLKDNVFSEFDELHNVIYAKHQDPETQNAVLFVANGGEAPLEYLFEDEQGRPAAGFNYGGTMSPDEKMTFIQIIGTCRSSEEKEMVDYLCNNYEDEIKSYEAYINDMVYTRGKVFTGDLDFDKTAFWAKAVMSVNAHYLDGEILPMPCPAEYNFFFTHDTLQADFSAINFDAERVKKDLLYIARFAKDDGIIPHARYWKDKDYFLEFVGTDNWNHFWFVTVCGKYLRHTGDVETVKELYPLISKSAEQMLVNKKDDLIYAYRPDWWDIGKSFGPRTYMTVHAIHSLREFLYICTVLGENPPELEGYEDIAEAMEKGLSEKLWDEEKGYLFNYLKDGSKDNHYYTGSLLAAHYDLLDLHKKELMVKTAGEKLLDEKTGIFNAFPMDFHELGDEFHFCGDEMGKPFYYMNGGIWYHGSAWYALALISAGKKEEALEFMKNTMTLDGIMKGPGGQPAMYECRNGNRNDPANYGKVDKPQFLWAASWYLYTLYNLLGYRENEWNISFEPYIPEGQNKTEYEIIVKGKSITVENKGRGNYIQNIKYDGNDYPSSVIPEDISSEGKIEITAGNPENPYIASVDSILLEPVFDREAGRLSFSLKSFAGHSGNLKIISPQNIKNILLNGKSFEGNCNIEEKDGIYIINIDYVQENMKDTFDLYFAFNM